MKQLIILTMLLPALAMANETLLVCDGKTIEHYPNPVAAPLSEQMTLTIAGDYVSVSGRGPIRFDIRDGDVWVWSTTIVDEDWLYNLNTISGQLTKIVTTQSASDTRTGRYIATYQCRKTEGRLIE